MEGTARLFVSVGVTMTDGMRKAMQALKGIKGVRASPEGQIHITLLFLGDTDVQRIPALKENLRSALEGTGAFMLSLKGIGAFPNVRRPRVVWIGIDEGKDELAHLAELVRGAVSRTRLRQDGKPFSPHVTIARVQGPADISYVAGPFGDTVFSEYTVDSVRLMRSVLGPNGAKHTELACIDLG